MNRLLTITSGLLIASGACAEFSVPALTVESKIEFNSARVDEGRRSADHNFAPSVRVGLPVLDKGEAYVGLDAYLIKKNKLDEFRLINEGNEIAPYVGFSYDVTDMFTVDAGYICRALSNDTRIVSTKSGGKSTGFGLVSDDGKNFLKNPAVKDAQDLPIATLESGNYKVEDLISGAVAGKSEILNFIARKKHTHSVYVGMMSNVLLSPSVYFNYDFTQKKANIEGAVKYTFDLGNVGVNGFAIDLGANIGYTRVTKPYGIKYDTKVRFVTEKGIKDNKTEDKFVADDHVAVFLTGENTDSLFDKKGWFYAGANADLVYSVNENTKARAGAAFSFNNADKHSWINSANSKKHNIWFSSAVEFSF